MSVRSFGRRLIGGIPCAEAYVVIRATTPASGTILVQHRAILASSRQLQITWRARSLHLHRTHLIDALHFARSLCDARRLFVDLYLVASAALCSLSLGPIGQPQGAKIADLARGDSASQILCEIPRPIPSKMTRRPLVLEINRAYRDVTRF